MRRRLEGDKPGGTTARILDALANAALVGLMVVVLLHEAHALAVVGSRAHVGDRIEVRVVPPASEQGLVLPARIVSGPWAAAGRACRLNLARMARPGGAMTVMAVRGDGVMLSWAGGTTAAGRGNCQTPEKILLDKAAYQKLRQAEMPAARLIRR
jgi:hypothetical protein